MKRVLPTTCDLSCKKVCTEPFLLVPFVDIVVKQGVYEFAELLDSKDLLSLICVNKHLFAMFVDNVGKRSWFRGNEKFVFHRPRKLLFVSGDQCPESLPVCVEKMFFPPMFAAAVHSFPASLRVLHLSDYTSCRIPELPASLRSLYAPFEALRILRLPRGLRTLELRVGRQSALTEWNSGLLADLPEDLERLIIQPFVPFDFYLPPLPKNLKKLLLPHPFNQAIDNLPAGLISLTLGVHFDQPVDRLPHSLKHLKLIGEFDQPVDNLPPNLEKLVLGASFDQPLDRLPRSLKRLYLDEGFHQPIDNMPSSLEVLHLGHRFNHSVDKLPHSLLELDLGYEFDQPIDNLPPKLQRYFLFSCSFRLFNFCFRLCFGFSFNRRLDSLPNSLRELYLGDAFREPLEKLPEGLTHLTVGSNFKGPLTIPKSLLALTFYWTDEHEGQGRPLTCVRSAFFRIAPQISGEYPMENALLSHFEFIHFPVSGSWFKLVKKS